jgi:hypothetical protein
VIAEIVDDSFNGPTMEEVAIRIGELRFEDSAHTSAGDGVCKSEGQNTNDRGKEEAKRRSIKDIADEE